MTHHALTATSGTLHGINGIEVEGGRAGQPRFQQDLGQPVRLRTELTYDEYETAPFDMYVGTLTAYVKVSHTYALGSGVVRSRGTSSSRSALMRSGVGTSS